MIKFVVPGKPIAKQSFRMGAGGRGFQPAAVTNYAARVGVLALGARTAAGYLGPLEGPVSIDITALFAIAKSWSKKKQAEAYWMTSKPDGDNIMKAIKDGVGGILVANDSQFCVSRIEKRYTRIPGNAGSVVVIVEPLVTGFGDG